MFVLVDTHSWTAAAVWAVVAVEVADRQVGAVGRVDSTILEGLKKFWD